MTTDRIAVDIKVPNQTRYLCLIGHIGENIAHTLRHYSGDREKLALFMDSKNVVFVNLENHRYLNLDPLLLYEEAAGKAPDIFFYNGMDNPGSADYSACKHGGTFNSSKSERAAEIAEELKGFINLYCLGKLQEATNG